MEICRGTIMGLEWVDGEEGLTANGRSSGRMCAAMMGLCAMGFAGQGCCGAWTAAI